MASKFSGLITAVIATFILAFQEYAIDEKNKNENADFTCIYNHFLVVLSFLTAGLILAQQVYFYFFIDKQYIESILYIPIIMLGVYFSCINSFYGAAYFAYSKTKWSFITTLIGAAVNVGLCVALVEPFGLWGVATASVLAYFAMCISRYLSTRKYFVARFQPSKVLISLTITGTSILIYYLNSYSASIVAFSAVAVVFLLYYGRMGLKYLKSRGGYA